MNPLLANTIANCSEKNGALGSPCCTLVVPPLTVATKETASAGVTFWNSGPEPRDWTSTVAPSGLESTWTNGPWQQSFMHPTPRTSTSSSSPASRTAFTRASFTPLELDDMHPAARQQWMVCFLAAARSFWVISMRSSMIMVEPSFHMFQSRLGTLPRRDCPIIDHCRRDPAGSNAPRRQQRKTIVRRGFPRFDARFCLDCREHFIPAFHIASCPHTNHTGMLALGMKGEKVIKSRHPVNPAGRQLELARDEQKQIVFKISKEVLGFVEHLDQGILLKLMLLHVRLEDLEPLVTAGMFQNLRKAALCGP